MLVNMIKNLAMQNNTTIAEIERNSEITRGTIGRWDKNIPSADKLYRVANLLSVSMEYLLTGEDTSVHNSLTNDEQSLINKYKQLNYTNKIKITERISMFLELQKEVEKELYTKEVPSKIYSIREKTDNYQYETELLGLISAGKGIDTIENKEIIKAPVKCDFALQVIGNSMEPKYHNKQILYFKQTPTVEQGQIAAVQVDDFIPIAYLKKVYIEESIIRLVSLNSNYKDIIYPSSKVKILGRVVD